MGKLAILLAAAGFFQTTTTLATTDKHEAKETFIQMEADRMENQFRGVLTDKKGIALKGSDQRAFRVYCDSKNGHPVMSLEFEENRYLKVISITADHNAYVAQCRDTIDEIWSRLVSKGQKLVVVHGKESFRLDKFTEN